MKHTYKITGMSCDGCRMKVEKALNAIEGISTEVSLKPAEAIITMDRHVPTEELQKAVSAAGNYTIEMQGHQKKKTESQHLHHQTNDARHNPAHHDHGIVAAKPSNENSGDQYYCPMHCEGDKTYDKPRNCPVCGMDLLKQPSLRKVSQYTCPMHPEIIRDQPGSCPICGMDLVPMATNKEEEDDKTYEKLLLKFKIAAIFTIPIFLIAMSEMIPGNPLFEVKELRYWNWVQLVLSVPSYHALALCAVNQKIPECHVWLHNKQIATVCPDRLMRSQQKQ